MPSRFCAVAALLRTRGETSQYLPIVKKRRRSRSTCSAPPAPRPARADHPPTPHLLQGHARPARTQGHQLAAVARRDLGAAARRPRPGAAARQGSVESRLPRDAGRRRPPPLKVLRTEREQVARHSLVSETKVVFNALSDHLVGFYDAFLHEGAVYLALEYMDAGSLLDVRTPRARCVPEPLLAHILFQTAGAHVPPPRAPRRPPRPRREHPAQRAGFVKLSDFGAPRNSRGGTRGAQFGRAFGRAHTRLSPGISKQLDSTRELAESYCGTRAYMSPERTKGEPYGLASDVWSFGCWHSRARAAATRTRRRRTSTSSRTSSRPAAHRRRGGAPAALARAPRPVHVVAKEPTVRLDVLRCPPPAHSATSRTRSCSATSPPRCRRGWRRLARCARLARADADEAEVTRVTRKIDRFTAVLHREACHEPHAARGRAERPTRSWTRPRPWPRPQAERQPRITAGARNARAVHRTNHKVAGDTTARLVVFALAEDGRLMRRAFGCAGWQRRSPPNRTSRAGEASTRWSARTAAIRPTSRAWWRAQLRHHARRQHAAHFPREPLRPVGRRAARNLRRAHVVGLLSRVTFQSVAILGHPVHTVESIYAQFDGEIEQIDHRWRGRLPKPLFFRAAAEYLLFTWPAGRRDRRHPPQLDSRRLERRRRVQRQAVRRALRQRHALAVAHRFPDLPSRRGGGAGRALTNVRSVDLLHTRLRAARCRRAGAAAAARTSSCSRTRARCARSTG